MAAAANHKLTTIIAGRTISGMSPSGDKTMVTFDDGSQMTIKTAGAFGAGDPASRGTGGKVAKVRQSVDPAVLYLDLEAEQPSIEVPLAEATSSVMLRGKDGSLEYAD
jgi:hypothetical protein